MVAWRPYVRRPRTPADALRRVINDVEARGGLRISRIRINEPSLEEAFIRVIGGDENG